MDTFTSVLEFLTYWLVDQYWFPVFLIGSGIFFTIYLGFPQITMNGEYIGGFTELDAHLG